MLIRATMMAAVVTCLFAHQESRAQSVQAAKSLTLAAPISDHMVLQRGKPTSVWGTAPIGSTVTVEFAGQSVIARTDDQGRWNAELKPMTTSAEPDQMVVTSQDGQAQQSLMVNDVLVGEVWMCSGQSNMFFPLSRIAGLEPYKQAVADSHLPNMRFFNTTLKTAQTPQPDCDGQWQVVTPQTVGEFSAVGYFFGRQLHEQLGVPIGLIGTAWGGKPVEAFTSYEKLKSVAAAQPLLSEWQGIANRYDPDMAHSNYEAALARWTEQTQKLRVDAKKAGKPVGRLPKKPSLQSPPLLDSNYPGAIYNQMIAPWTRYAIAGAIWYQGEANRNRASQYRSLLRALIEDWRSRWDDEFPFYIVQLANYLEPSTEPGTPSAWAELQDAQTFVARTVEGVDIAVINDIGEAGDIHPKNKLDVGLRLSLLALKHAYGFPIAPHAGPLYKGHSISGNQVRIDFDHVGDGLKTRDGGELKRFEIAGNDRVWHWADADRRHGQAADRKQ